MKEVAEALISTKNSAGSRILQPRGAPKGRGRIARKQREGRRVTPHVVQRPGDQVPGPVAHEVGGIAIGQPVVPRRSVVLPLRAVVSERQVGERLRSPASRSGFQLVDAVPAVAFFERRNILQTRPSIRARRAPDRASGHETLAPDAPVEFPALPLAMPSARPVKGIEQALEVVGSIVTSASTLTRMSGVTSRATRPALIALTMGAPRSRCAVAGRTMSFAQSYSASSSLATSRLRRSIRLNDHPAERAHGLPCKRVRKRRQRFASSRAGVMIE